MRCAELRHLATLRPVAGPRGAAGMAALVAGANVDHALAAVPRAKLGLLAPVRAEARPRVAAAVAAALVEEAHHPLAAVPRAELGLLAAFGAEARARGAPGRVAPLVEDVDH